MTTSDRINAIIKFRLALKKCILQSASSSENDAENADFNLSIILANQHNQWFVKENVIQAFDGIVKMLESPDFENWINKYVSQLDKNHVPKRVGIIMAGNIPMVGFHDLMCVLLSGNVAVLKLSSDDKILMTYLIKLLIKLEPAFEQQLEITERMQNLDAAIATGSNNSSRYFDFYFSKIPNIIRKNRNSVAVLSGNESREQLKLLGKDIFSYFGLGCRNVSKLYVPVGYDFTAFFECMLPYADVLNHNKYMNNYDYHNAIFLLNNQQFLTNNYMIVKEDKGLATPVSVTNYEYYNSMENVLEILFAEKENIQCIVSENPIFENAIAFGNSQSPAVNDYADNFDTMEFLLKL